ncbi:MAG: hypothetical protein Q9196_002692 [Gyalolechia fulgens]
MPLLTRIAHRIKDAREEYTERIQDSQSGHRDKYGRKTHLWHEREYEGERRRRKREHKRKEKEMIEGKGKKIEAVMSGAMPKDDGHVALVEEAGEHGEMPIVQRAEGSGEHGVGHEGVVGSRRISRMSTGYQSRRGGGSGPRDISPMPSEHSFSSIQAQVHNRRATERARARAEGRHQRSIDSEDEEEDESDEGSLDEEDEGAEAVKNIQEPAVDGIPLASGLRGGGGGGVAEVNREDLPEDECYSFDEKEYNEREDFDGEYLEVGSQQTVRHSPGLDQEEGKNIRNAQKVHKPLAEEHSQPESSSASNGASKMQDDELKEDASDFRDNGHRYQNAHSIDRPQNLEIGSSSDQGNDGEPKSEIGGQPNGELPDRTPRPYTLGNVHDTLKLVRPVGVSNETGEWIPVISKLLWAWPSQNHNAQTAGEVGDDVEGGPAPRQEETPQPKVRPTKAPKDPWEDGKRAQGNRAGPERAPKPTKKAPYEDWKGAQGRSAGARAHIYQDYASDDCRPDAKFSKAMPQAHAPYRGDLYSSYGNYSHHKGPRYGGQYWSRFGRSGGGNAPWGRLGGQSAGGTYKGRRFTEDNSALDGEPDERQKPRRRRVPESSAHESSSDDDVEPPPARQRREEAENRRVRERRPQSREPSSCPPPRRSTRRAAGKRPERDKSPPPKYDSVDSVKEAPTNYYALLGIQPNATPKEKARIQAHTDQLLKLGHNKTEKEVAKINARAGRVGQAAEVLKDPVQRAEYDMEVRNWKRKHGGVLPVEEED